MRKVLLFLFLGIMAGTVSAQSIFTNPIDGSNPSSSNPLTTGQTVDPNLTVSGVGRSSNISAASASNRYNASGWTTSASIDLGDYFEFTLTANSGYEIDFVSFVYSSQASGSGPSAFAVRSSIDGYTTDLGTATASGATTDLSGPDFQDISTSISFRVYGWDASAGGGTFSINDFTFNGTVASVGGGPTAPVVHTASYASITTGSADLGGTISSDGGSAISARGIVWSATNTDPMIGGADVADVPEGGTATGVFTVPVNGLPSGSLIYFRAYASNAIGTAYSSVSSFSTLKGEPTGHVTGFSCGPTTSASIPLSWTDAAGGIVPDGYLVKWSSTDFASIAPPVDGTPEANGPGVMNVPQGAGAVNISGLSQTITYYFRTFPYTNSGGDIDFKTDGTVPQTSCTTQAGLWEEFESGSKTAYASASVILASGSWTFDDALIGTSANDRRNGLQSARIRNGSISMDFDIVGGVGTVSVYHALYGSDDPTTWTLEASNNGGLTWDAYVSSPVTTTSTTLTGQVFPLNLAGTIRFRIIKQDANGDRLSIDDISYTEFAGAPLPVLFTNFRAEQKGSAIQLHWTNETEEQVHSYSIQRSADGRVFKTIGSTMPLKNDHSSVSYVHLDQAPLKGDNFYRIMAKETDGQEVYTPIIRISPSASQSSMVVYPNPASGGQLNLQLASLPEGAYTIRVYNSNGQRILTRAINHGGGTSTQPLPLAQLRSGLYHIVLTGAVELRQSFIVQ